MPGTYNTNYSSWLKLFRAPPNQEFPSGLSALLPSFSLSRPDRLHYGSPWRIVSFIMKVLNKPQDKALPPFLRTNRDIL